MVTRHDRTDMVARYFGFVTSISCNRPQTTPQGTSRSPFREITGPAEAMGLSSWLLATFEDLFQSGFVSRSDFLTGQAEDLRISQPCSRASSPACVPA